MAIEHMSSRHIVDSTITTAGSCRGQGIILVEDYTVEEETGGNK